MPVRYAIQIMSCLSEGKKDLNLKQTGYISTMIAFALEKAIQVCLDTLLTSS